MLKMILDFLGGIFEAVGGFFKWRASPNEQYRSAEKDVEKNDAAIAKKKQEASDAVYGGDEVKVNSIIHGSLCVAVSLVLTCAAGCFSGSPEVRTVRVPEAKWVRAVTNETGAVSHWEVPPSVMTELLDAKIERDELLKRQRINERLNTK